MLQGKQRNCILRLTKDWLKKVHILKKTTVHPIVWFLIEKQMLWQLGDQLKSLWVVFTTVWKSLPFLSWPCGKGVLYLERTGVSWWDQSLQDGVRYATVQALPHLHRWVGGNHLFEWLWLQRGTYHFAFFYSLADALGGSLTSLSKYCFSFSEYI